MGSALRKPRIARIRQPPDGSRHHSQGEVRRPKLGLSESLALSAVELRCAKSVSFLTKTTNEIKFRSDLIAEDPHFLCFCQKPIREIRVIRGLQVLLHFSA